MAVSGKRLVCRSRLKRSSSTNATMRPSRSRHADVSWLKQLMPRMLCTAHPSASDNPRTSSTRRVLPLRRPVRPVSGAPGLVLHQRSAAAPAAGFFTDVRKRPGRRVDRGFRSALGGADRAGQSAETLDASSSSVYSSSSAAPNAARDSRSVARCRHQAIGLIDFIRVRPLDLGSVVTLGPASRGKVTIQRSPPTRSGHEESQNHDGRPPYSAGKVVVGVVGGSVAGGAVVGGAVVGGAVVGGEVVRVVLGGLVVPVTRWVVVVARPLVVLVDPLSGNPWAGPNTPGPLVVVGRVLPEASVGAGRTSPALPDPTATVVDGRQASRVAHCDEPLTGPPMVSAAITPSPAAAAAAIPHAAQRPRRNRIRPTIARQGTSWPGSTSAALPGDPSAAAAAEPPALAAAGPSLAAAFAAAGEGPASAAGAPVPGPEAAPSASGAAAAAAVLAVTTAPAGTAVTARRPPRPDLRPAGALAAAPRAGTVAGTPTGASPKSCSPT